MKRIFPLLFLLLVLCGCGADSQTPTEAPPTESAVEPTGFYVPDSELENSTGGAVQVYPLNRDDCYGMVPMGEDILLFTGTESTTLIRASGANLYIAATTELDSFISPEDCSVQVSEKGVTFYDRNCRELVFLDANLKDVSRVSLPDDIQGDPALSAGRKTLYYCTSSSLRVLDMETGFHKLLKEIFFEQQSVHALHYGGSVLECSTTDRNGFSTALFISTETGETLWEASEALELTTSGQTYFAVRQNGAYQELLSGTTGSDPYALYFSDIHAEAMPLLERNGVVLVSTADDGAAVTLHYFDLESGMRTAALELPGNATPASIHAEADDQYIWLLRYDEAAGCDTLYRWEPEKTLTGDTALYLASRITAEAPDTQGLERCREKAAELSVKHGVDVRIWTDALSESPANYTLTAEFQVPVILESLEALDQALASYPSGFLKEAASGSSSGTLRLALVRSIRGDPLAGTQENPAGVQFWNSESDACIVLCVSADPEQNLYHELFHLIESRVMSTCSAYDDWEKLNPEGFRYDYSYLTNQSREDTGLTEGENRAFIDIHSMSYPKEDRARIMEYAMTPGNEAYFTSDVMQAKLRQLCLGIREAFDLEDSPEHYLWEQYLEEPLTENET